MRRARTAGRGQACHIHCFAELDYDGCYEECNGRSLSSRMSKFSMNNPRHRRLEVNEAAPAMEFQ